MSSQLALAPRVLVRRSSESSRGSLVYGCRSGGMREDELMVNNVGRNYEGGSALESFKVIDKGVPSPHRHCMDISQSTLVLN